MNKLLCICASLFLATSSLAFAPSEKQYAPPDPQTAAASSAERDRPEGLIKLDVLVTGATGDPVSGLSKADFSLLENGHPQNLLSFQVFDGRGAGREPAVKIILLIDIFDIPERLAHQERLAVMSYLRQRGGKLQRPVSVFELVDTGLWAVAPSGDGNVLAREIEHNEFKQVRSGADRQTGPIQRESKSTPQDSALRALGQIATDERKRPGRKLLLWVGPGSGMGTGAYAAAAPGSPPPFDTVWWFSSLLREAHLVLSSFTVAESDPHALLYKDFLAGVTSPQKASFMNVNRKVLAVQSGGRVMENSVDLGQQIESCGKDAGPFYRISFDPFPADHPNEYHDLKVQVNRPGLLARTNTGYYDQPYYTADLIPPPRRISVAQLTAMLTASHGESDSGLARRLSGLTLTERLGEHRLAFPGATALGKLARRELRILADASAFLDPPPDEIPHDATPDLNAQRQMLVLASEYLGATIRKLPNLFARQTTVRFQETPLYLEAGTSVSYQPLHITDSSTTTVHYQNGNEIFETRTPRLKPNVPQLITYGVFGPALQGVLQAIHNHDQLTWSRWEQIADRRIAVFRYSIPPDKSRRQFWLCCLPDGDGTEAFQRYAGYHEEIAIDPESGVILRLEYLAEFESATPMARSDIMVEFGPVDIAGQTYVCPLKSVSIVRARSVRVLRDWDEAFKAYGPYTTMLNEITFDRYHIFRSDSQMLTDLPPEKK